MMKSIPSINPLIAIRNQKLFYVATFMILFMSFELAHAANPQISGGADHSLALKSDGTVWAWGENWWGQLGDGTTPGRSCKPVQVSGLSGVIAISGGGGHSLALKSDGTVWAWGYNKYGELGYRPTLGITQTLIDLGIASEVPEISVSPNPLDLGSVTVGRTSDQTITVRNDGTANLVVTTITNPAPPFSKVVDSCSGQSIPPGGTCTVTYRFSPGSEGVFLGNSNIYSNDPDESPVSVSLKGRALEEAICPISIGDLVVNGEDCSRQIDWIYWVSGNVTIAHKDSVSSPILRVEGGSLKIDTSLDQISSVLGQLYIDDVPGVGKVDIG